VTCRGCDGKGKRKEDRSCTACKGEGAKRCVTCGGTARVTCSRCHGKGQVKKPMQGSAGQGALDLRKAEMGTVPGCQAAGKTMCSKCVDGKLQCLVCKGAKHAPEVGPCSECSARGLLPCPTCNGTGARDKMRLKERQDMEKALSLLCGAP